MPPLQWAIGISGLVVDLGGQQYAPCAVVVDVVGIDGVVTASDDQDARSARSAGDIGASGCVCVVVVVHRVVRDQPARMGACRTGLVTGAVAGLGRRLVVVVLAVSDDPNVVVVELGVLDDQAAAGIGSRVAEP